MRALLLLLAALVGSVATTLVCPPRYFNIEGRCIRPYGLYANDYLELIMKYAQEGCDEAGAYLPIIRSREENEWFNRIAHTFIQMPAFKILVLLGTVCDEETDELRWLDGSSIAYEGPRGSDSLQYNCSYNHRMPISNVRDNRWELLPKSDFMPFTSLCVIEEKVEPTTEEPDNRCGDYDRMEEGMNEDAPCYKVFTEPQSWENAQKKCTIDFGSLIEINSAEENSFFWNIADSYNFKGGIHIGAHQSPDDSSKWTWIDGEIPISSNTFNKFIKSFPIAGSGKCASMATESVAAAWVNVDCLEDELPFICQRGENSVIPSSCPSAAPKPGEEIYSPSYPKSDLACEYFLTVSADKLVEIEIISLISENNIDFLEILEGTSGMKTLANLTGSPLKPAKFTTTKSNVLRVNWKPSGTGEGRGFKIRYTEVAKEDEVTVSQSVTVTSEDQDEGTTTKSATSPGIFTLIVALLFCFTS